MPEPFRITELAEFDLENQRVFLRTDLDGRTEKKSGTLLDDFGVKNAIPTLRRLLAQGARVVVGSRFGETKLEPGSVKEDRAPSIEPAGQKLAELLGVDVILPDSCTGEAVKKVTSQLREGQVCLLENLAREGDFGPQAEAFARSLLEYVDMYVGDAPRALRFESATTTILPRLVERRFAGQNLTAELSAVSRVRSAEQKLIVWGGGHLSKGLPVLRALLGPNDRVFFVGVPAMTLLAASGRQVGRSTVETGYLAGGRTLLDKWHGQLRLPRDFLVGEEINATESRVREAGAISDREYGLDLGPETLTELDTEIRRAETVLWCGSLGYHKNPTFSGGTKSLLQSLAQAAGFTMIAGEDSVSAALALSEGSVEGVSRVATGGATTLSLLTDSKLLGLEALRGMSHESTNTPDRR